MQAPEDIAGSPDADGSSAAPAAAAALPGRHTMTDDKVNVLLVGAEPEKLRAYAAMLGDLDANLVKVSSAPEALQFLLKNDVAVVLLDVGTPGLDGLQLAATIREHGRLQKTAIVFISPMHLADVVDRLRGCDTGAVDCVAAPVIPDVLRAKVGVFAELFRTTRKLERSNLQLKRRVAELEASNARLEQNTEKCTFALSGGEMGLCLARGAGRMGSWVWELATDAWKWDEAQHRIFGVDPREFQATAQNIRGLIHPDDWRSLRRCVKRMRDGARTQQFEFRVLRPDGETRWCTGTAAASVDAAGRLVRICGVTIDITDRKQAEERQALLAREVDHRARNALAVIQSIIRLTRAQSVDDYLLAIEGRIKALARAHTLLSDSRWHGADLATLVAEELAPYRAGDKITFSGPDISLQPSLAQGLALALHELATNAVKHGALSSASGTVSFTWQLQPHALIFNWAENGGPQIAPPAARSFGLRVIRASIEQQLGGAAAFDWDPKGLRCSFSIPRRDMVKYPPSAPARNGSGINGAADPLKVAGKPRVLLVEDEALVAMMIEECLAEFGYQVIGPVRTAAEAMAKAKDDHFEAAILDINLSDGTVYPVADMLAARGVPFVFVTGYDTEGVDGRFRNVPTLQKPIGRETLKTIFVVAAKASVTR